MGPQRIEAFVDRRNDENIRALRPTNLLRLSTTHGAGFRCKRTRSFVYRFAPDQREPSPSVNRSAVHRNDHSLTAIRTHRLLESEFGKSNIFLLSPDISTKLTFMGEVSDKIIFYDIETGGLHFDAPIIELAAIAVQAGTYKELDTIDMKIEFSTKDPHVSMEALGVNKFSAEVWEKFSIPPADAAIKFAHFLREHGTVEKKSESGNEYSVAKLAGHNAQSFDSPFVMNWFKKHGPKSKGQDPFFPALRLTLDTIQLADWFLLE